MWKTPKSVKREKRRSFWRARAPPGYRPLGDCAMPTLVTPGMVVVVSDPSDSGLLASPQRVRRVWPSEEAFRE
eukprot:7293507-Pyramimonas_sp.AAC.1